MKARMVQGAWRMKTRMVHGAEEATAVVPLIPHTYAPSPLPSLDIALIRPRPPRGSRPPPPQGAILTQKYVGIHFPKFVDSNSPNTEGALRAPNPKPLRRHPKTEVRGHLLS